MTIIKSSTLLLVLLIGLGSTFWAIPDEPDPSKPPQLEKDTWRYQVEAVIRPAKYFALYRIALGYILNTDS